ncbi:TIGR03619 family F420-dependent LLM class oxidoreductase [Trebonia kvetii]|uniref:TIGR03619 family F420-dependent LLM class oxidoreductase n=1 Tax=Trebonia kvetii TaxID=2480626 RepID=A0A6P2C5G8_9ACTN|nr:TIGR03619 family F420-dependent LLM class oxidoreductase [Trebonia kvetii]TVZ06679.1 TIGR03619 family F420-dependent LLM class oxidoreductase [Trebonia kvetii]
MRFGLSVYDVSATELADLAAAAETAGFDTLWLGEHLLRPVDYHAVHPTREPEQELAARIVGPETRLTDPLVALAAAAGRTSRLQLATGIYVLPLRHPLAVARATLTLQELAEGRLLFGVGLGWLREEFEALGVPFADRAARFSEGLDILRKAWAGGPFEHRGSVYDFGPVELTAQPARIPLVLGGNTAPALRRAALRADGWFASGTPSPTEAVDLMARLDAAQAAAGRAVPLTTYVRASQAADITRYANAGFSQVVFWAHELCPPGPGRWDRLAAAAAELGVTEGTRP